MEPASPSVPQGPFGELARAIEVVTGKPPLPSQLLMFSRYLDLLLSWTRTYRLTGHRSPEGIVRDLFIDSVLFLSFIPPSHVYLMDIGTGPGIPGIPLRIVRDDISLTLVESRRTRISFLNAVRRELGLDNMAIIEGRVESVVRGMPELRNSFDVVVSRAVGIAGVLEAAWECLKPGGIVVAGGAPGGVAAAYEGTGLNVSSETVSFRGLGLSRTFVLGRKPA